MLGFVGQSDSVDFSSFGNMWFRDVTDTEFICPVPAAGEANPVNGTNGILIDGDLPPPVPFMSIFLKVGTGDTLFKARGHL